MTIRYVGPGGSDSNDGLTWDTRKLTLTGVEDTPVVAGDTVYVGPGTYRETLTVDVSGSSGNPISYIGDVTGAYTDGIGGLVRLTAYDSETGSPARTYLISATSRTYRTFVGFNFDGCASTSQAIYVNGAGTGWIFTDCVWTNMRNMADAIHFNQGGGIVVALRRCIGWFHVDGGTFGFDSSNYDNSGTEIENCLFTGWYGWGCIQQGGGLLMRNNSYINVRRAVNNSTTVTYMNYIYNSIFDYVTYSDFNDDDYLTDDYNNHTPTKLGFTPPTYGANSIEEHIRYRMPLTGLGHNVEPVDFGVLSPNELTIGRFTDNGNAPNHDLFGLPRSATNGKRSLGAIQEQGVYRELTTTRNSSVSSLGIKDFGAAQFIIAVMETKLTVSVYVYREADYTGTLPQLIIKRPGQADITITDTGSSATWNLLTTTFVHNGKPPWIAVQLQSNNTATSGNYKVFFEDLVLE